MRKPKHHKFKRDSKPKRSKPRQKGNPSSNPLDGVRLNKYIANTGLCSRRQADDLITLGEIKINGKIITQLGTKVLPEDVVKYKSKVLSGEKKVYVLLNKPKDHITTVEDTHGRKTVMDLVRNACKERIYPVGRLDRNTTGILLLTNDGELTKKLTHPRYGVKKVYHAVLDKRLKPEELSKIAKGLKLDDGIAEVDVISYIGDGRDKKLVGIELHSGKNRIIRRIFEHLGYKVVKLDRIYYAGLTKKDVPKGRWRLLSGKEVGMLMMTSG